MALNIKEVKAPSHLGGFEKRRLAVGVSLNGAFYKELELLVSENV